jgi:hypothetical protein
MDLPPTIIVQCACELLVELGLGLPPMLESSPTGLKLESTQGGAGYGHHRDGETPGSFQAGFSTAAKKNRKTKMARDF